MKKLFACLLIGVMQSVFAQTFPVQNLLVNGTTTLTIPLGVSSGGIGTGTAGGSALDNVSGFTGTGFVNRLGTGSYATQSTVGVGNGGTGSSTAVGAYSNLGVIPNASGSQLSTTASMSSGSTSVTLANAQDFRNGQGLMIIGAGPAFSGTNPTGITVTPVGTTGSTTYSYNISCMDSTGGMSAATSSVTTNTGNATLTNVNYNQVSWTAGTCTGGYAIYRNGSLVGATPDTNFRDCGGTVPYPPSFIALTPPGAARNEWLLTTILTGGGTTSLTVLNAASNTVSGAVAQHDDTAAIQNAINSLPANGGTLMIQPTYYNISFTLLIGNGTNSSWSTKMGQNIVGQGVNNAWSSNNTQDGSGNPGGVRFVWQGVAGDMVHINGPIAGWAFDNIGLDGQDVAYACLTRLGAQFGHANNLSTYRCELGNYGQVQFTQSSSSSEFRNGFMIGKTNGFWNGINENGPSNGDSYDNLWMNTSIVGKNNSYGQAIVLGSVDSDVFINTHMGFGPGSLVNSVVFDYSHNSGGWPASTIFYGLDPENYAFANVGTPPVNGAWNMIYGLQGTNGGNCPGGISGLYCSPNGQDALNYVNSSGQSIPNNSQTQMTNCTKLSDRLGTNFSASTCTFTAPFTGYYTAEVAATFNPGSVAIGNTFTATIQTSNGAQCTGTVVSQSSSTANIQPRASCSFQLNAGQTATVLLFQNTGNSVSLYNVVSQQTYFSIQGIQ